MAGTPAPLPPGFDKLLDDLYFRLEERDRWAEHIIQFLFTANGGGIVVVMAYAGVLTNANRSVLGLAWGLLAFSAGLLLVGIELGVGAAFVRQGRRAARVLMARVFTENLAYHEVFLKMGDKTAFPSKWWWFSLLTLGSFICFFVGLAASFLSVAQVRIFCT